MTENGNLFKPASWLAKIDFINHLILFNNVLMAVLGENKGGKTSFVSMMQSTVNNQVRKGLFNARPGCSIEDVQQAIADQFQLKYSPGQDLSALIIQANERKSQLLLIIDDAHFLPDSWIEQALAALKSQGSQGYFHLCLVSDYSIVPTLNKFARDQYSNQIHTIELGSLSEGETKVYIAQKLQQLQGPDLVINDKLLTQYHRQTAGDLAKINANLSCYLKEMMTASLRGQSHRLRKTAVTLSLLVMTAGLTYQVLNHGGWLNHQQDLLVDLAVQPPPTAALVLTNSVQTGSLIPNWQENATVQVVTAAMPFKTQDSREEELFEEEPDLNLVVRDRVVFIPEIRKPIAAREDQPMPVLVSSLAPFPGFPPKVDSPKAVMPQLGKAAQPRVIQKPDSPAQANGREYTIQLLASHRVSDLHDFVKKNKLEAKTRIYQVKYQDSIWYVLTMGRYVDYSKANAEVKGLPKTLSSLNPWVRTTTPLKDIPAVKLG